jgi:HJR/Mrr/RecB family endonuclease
VSNPARRKGTDFETAVVDYLSAHGFPYAERRAQRGSKDAGDVAGVVGWVLEVKNHKALDLGPWVTEAATEAAHDGASRFAVVHKRRGKSVSEAFVTLPLRLFAELVAEDAPA